MSVLFVCLAAIASPARGQRGLVGRRFMPKEGCTMKIGNREVRSFKVPLVVLQVSGEWLWVGEGWVQKSRVVPLEVATSYYTEYLHNHPATAWAYRGRGSAWRAQGQYDNALKDFSEAMRLDPREPFAYVSRGKLWCIKGDYDNALKDFTEAIRMDPQLAYPYANRASAWRAKGEYDNVLKDCTEAIRVDAGYADSYNEMAWLLATCTEPGYRDGQRAVTMARRACELSRWSDANHVDTLAAAFAESGDFDEAIRWQTKSMGMPDANSELVKGARERVALYRDQKPYREGPMR